MPKIIIIGGGFGGLYSYIYLRKQLKHTPAQITLISPENYFLFTPLLHEVATGSVNQSNIIYPLRKLVRGKNARFIQGSVQKIDTAQKIVTTENETLNYDYLVIAGGSKPAMPTPHTFTLKNLQNARNIKNHIIEMFEQSERSPDPKEREKLLTFVVVGAGPTGVELAAEIHEFTTNSLTRYYNSIKPEEVETILIHSGSEIIPQFKPKLRTKSLQILQKNARHLQIILNTKVIKVTPDQITLSNNQTINTQTTIMTIGVQANALQIIPEPNKNTKAQLEVNENLQLFNANNVFALGDIAHISSNNQIVPQTAQAAVMEAKNVAQNIKRALTNKPAIKFQYQEKGQLLSLGGWKAAAYIGGLYFNGHLAWWIWRTIYVSKMPGWSNRLRIILDWTLDIFYPRDISKL